MKLTATRIRSLTGPGLYGDGNNLWLRITDTGSKSWVFRYMLHGKARVMGLGSLDLVPLGEARQKAAEARKLLLTGHDPLDQREQHRAEAKAREKTFAYAAECYFAANQASWTSLYRRKWQHSFRAYALPVIGDLPVEAVDTDLIRRILTPIWDCKTATATVLRGRLEAVLSYATTLGWRTGPNPAVWRGHMKNILPRPSKVHTIVHYPALDWREAPAFMRRLREETNVAAYAIQFGILTAARSGEVLGATWQEIDFDAATWTIPAGRTKTRNEHRVPLSKPALAVLRQMELLRCEGGLIFPGHRDQGRRRLNHGGPMALLRRIGRSDISVHGFRSTFRDWAAETTHHPNHVMEQALAHTIGNAVEAAYRRGDLFEKRKALMDDWAEYLGRAPAEVVPIRQRDHLAS